MTVDAMTTVEMKIEPLRFSDDYVAQARWWLPPNPRGVVMYFHGIQSHGGWYEASGQALADAGFAVCMPDRRGSGLSAEPRGHLENLNRLTDDMRATVKAALLRSGQTQVHLVGVSWGGKQAVWLAQNMPETVASISLVCPGIFPKLDLPTSEKFKVALAMVNDRRKDFDIPLNDPSYFTDNVGRQSFVRDDELKLTQVSASFLLTSRRLDRAIRGFERSRYDGGVHLCLAGTDKIIDNEKTRIWYDSLPSQMKRLSEYEDGGHTLEFNAEPQPFFRELVGFIQTAATNAE